MYVFPVFTSLNAVLIYASCCMNAGMVFCGTLQVSSKAFGTVVADTSLTVVLVFRYSLAAAGWITFLHLQFGDCFACRIMCTLPFQSPSARSTCIDMLHACTLQAASRMMRRNKMCNSSCNSQEPGRTKEESALLCLYSGIILVEVT